MKESHEKEWTGGWRMRSSQDKEVKKMTAKEKAREKIKKTL